MHKHLLCATVVGVISLLATVPGTAQASDGTININGSVVAATCTVAVTGTSGSTVTLPTVTNTVLAAAGDTAGETAFSIALSGCNSVSNAATFFEAGPTVNAAGRLDNAAGGAANVDVELLNSDDSAIHIGSAAPASGAVGNVAVTGGAATLNYFARYYATGAAGTGAVATSVQFSMVYN